jgi:hypothetical protein
VVTGAATSIDKSLGTFDCNGMQYTTLFKDQVNLSSLPIHAHFNNIQYKTKKLVLYQTLSKWARMDREERVTSVDP